MTVVVGELGQRIGELPHSANPRVTPAHQHPARMHVWHIIVHFTNLLSRVIVPLCIHHTVLAERMRIRQCATDRSALRA